MCVWTGTGMTWFVMPLANAFFAVGYCLMASKAKLFLQHSDCYKQCNVGGYVGNRDVCFATFC